MLWLLDTIGIVHVDGRLQLLSGAVSPGLMPFALIIVMGAQARRSWRDGHRRAMDARRQGGKISRREDRVAIYEGCGHRDR